MNLQEKLEICRTLYPIPEDLSIEDCGPLLEGYNHLSTFPSEYLCLYLEDSQPLSTANKISNLFSGGVCFYYEMNLLLQAENGSRIHDPKEQKIVRLDWIKHLIAACPIDETERLYSCDRLQWVTIFRHFDVRSIALPRINEALNLKDIYYKENKYFTPKEAQNITVEERFTVESFFAKARKEIEKESEL